VPTFSPASSLSPSELEHFAHCANLRVGLTASARQAITRSHAVLRRLRERGTPIYGSTTGFGPFVTFKSGGADSAEHAIGLLEHLGAGAGEPAPREVVRAAMVVRVLTVARGYSGINPSVVTAYLDLVNSGATPVVPSIGSLGASGDLIPLAHIARPLVGRGLVTMAGKRLTGRRFLLRHKKAPARLEPRDALALVNGTSFSTAYAALSLAKAWRLLLAAERLTAFAYVTLRCNDQALHPMLHQARGQRGQEDSAAAIRAEIKRLGGYRLDPSRPLQEIYSLRCAPQVLGACRAQLTHAEGLVHAEINGVDDNPLIIPPDAAHPDGQAVHGGNFHAQQVAFAADAINAALTQVAILADRQIDLLANPQQNGGAPLLLARHPGRQSGLSGAQITSTAIVSEMRGRCQQHATSSIPTNGGNQDIVPMAATAGRAAYAQTDHLASILAVLAIALLQLNHLRRVDAAPGKPAYRQPDLPAFKPLDADRALHDDIARFAGHFLNLPLGTTNLKKINHELY